METFLGRFWEIPGNVWKLVWSKIRIDHKNALVFYQTVSGKPSWSFLTGEPNANKKKTKTAKHQFIALLGLLKGKTRMFFRLFFRLSAHFWPHSTATFHPNTHMFFCSLLAYDKWWYEQKKKRKPHLREKYLVLSYLNPFTDQSKNGRRRPMTFRWALLPCSSFDLHKLSLARSFFTYK